MATLPHSTTPFLSLNNSSFTFTDDGEDVGIYSCEANPNWQGYGVECIFDALFGHFDFVAGFMWCLWLVISIFLWMFTFYSTFKLHKDYKITKHNLGSLSFPAGKRLSNKKRLYVIITIAAVLQCTFIFHLCFMSPLWMAPNLVSWYHGWCCKNNIMWYWFYINYQFGNSTYGLSWILLILSYLYRLRVIFDNSLLEIGQKENIIVCIYVLISLVLLVIENCYHWDGSADLSEVKVLRTIGFINYVGINIWIAYLLANKLWQMALMHRASLSRIDTSSVNMDSNNTNASGDENDNNIENNNNRNNNNNNNNNSKPQFKEGMNNNKFVRILKRFSILTIISMTFSILSFLYIFIIFMAEVEIIDYQTFILIFYTNQYIDYSINVICLYIQFDFIGQNVYHHTCYHLEKLCKFK